MANYLLEAGAATLELLATCTDGLIVKQVAQRRGVTPHSARKTLQRLVDKKLVKTEPAGDCGMAMNTLLYTLTKLGREVAEGVHDVCDISSESDDDSIDVFPRPDVAPIIAEAMRTQPTSVFDLARVMRC